MQYGVIAWARSLGSVRVYGGGGGVYILPGKLCRKCNNALKDVIKKFI